MWVPGLPVLSTIENQGAIGDGIVTWFFHRDTSGTEANLLLAIEHGSPQLIDWVLSRRHLGELQQDFAVRR